RLVEQVHGRADVEGDHLEPFADANVVAPGAVADGVLLVHEVKPELGPADDDAASRERRSAGSVGPASRTKRSAVGWATTVTSTRAAHEPSSATPSRICCTSLNTYVPGRISVTPATPATIRAVGVDPTLISRRGRPAAAHRSAVWTRSRPSRSAIARSSCAPVAR